MIKFFGWCGMIGQRRLKVQALLFVTAGIVMVVIYYTGYRLLSHIFVSNGLHGAKTCEANGKTGEWYNFSSNVFRFFAYSAFYDDRPSLMSDPVIRIIAISDPVDDSKFKSVELHCVLHQDNAADVVLIAMQKNHRAIGFGWQLNREKAKEYVYTCPTVTGKIPDSLSITASPNDYDPSLCMPVTFPRKPLQKQEFGVCVQVAYGTLDPHRLIEWLEILKILGVSLVGVYDLSISEAGLKVLRHYSSEGFVDLRKTNAIYEHDDRHYFLQGSPVINDCIYRHMYEFSRIAVIDFDEFIMPRKHKNLSELVTYLDQLFAEKKESPKANYAFRNNYFFLDLPPDDMISPNFTVLRFRKKVKVSPEGYAAKSIINPQACTHMHNHYCWGLTAKYSHGYDGTGSVAPEIAVSQHYKKCHFSETECKTMMKSVTQDDVMLRLKDVITERVGAKIGIIMD